MIYQRVIGFCPDLADKIEEVVAERFGYEYFDDPISDARHEQQMFINRHWFRKEIIRALGGEANSAEVIDAVKEVRSCITDETLEAIFGMYRPFILHLSEDGFYAVDCIEENNKGSRYSFTLGYIHET